MAIFALLFSFTGFSQTISIGSPVDATEGSGLPASFIISLDNGAINTTGSDITGTIALGGSASPGVDYLGPVSFTIANGANSIGILVPIFDDTSCEGTETIIATISSVSVGTINPSNSFTIVNILDDDCGALIISIGSPVDAVEGTSNITFDIFIEGGGLNNTGAAITGNITYPSGSANPSADYIPVNNFSIPIGMNSTTITLIVTDDALIEATETVIPTLTGSPSVGSYGNTTVTANIIDDDAASLTLSIGSPVDGIEGSTFVSYIVSLDNGVTNATGAAITGLISYSGTAASAADYTEVSSFSIPDGTNSAFVILVVIDDALIECNETVIATISNPNIGTINPTAASSIANIIDDECAQFGISIGSPIDGVEGGVDVSFVVSLDNAAVNNSGSPILGTLSYSGTASFADFTTPPPVSFSIPDGANATTITLPVFDDLLLECDETVIATISNPSAGMIANATSTAIIVDDECTLASISIGTPTDGAENGADVSFVISLDNGIVNGTGGPITGDLVFTGTATPTSDFANNPTFLIPDGASFAVQTLSVLDDLIPEATESVIATISAVSIGAIGNSVDTAYILDDDSTSGIEPINIFDLKIYPNPTNSNLNISAEQQMNSYSIIDLNGRMLSQGEIHSKEVKLNTEFLAAGTYVLRILFENGTRLNKKVLKE